MEYEERSARRVAYLEEHGPAARKRKAVLRFEERAKRSPKEQLAFLDRQLGAGVGAVKERARLNALIRK